MYKKNYKNLKYFLSGYFHQDWVDEHDSFEEVIEFFLESESEDLVENVRNELAMLCDLGLEEQELASKLQHLGSYYHPTGDNLSYVAWLDKIRVKFGCSQDENINEPTAICMDAEE